MSPEAERKQRLRRRAALTSVSVASVLAAAKLVAALLSGSVAVLSSLADSLADIAASSLTLWTVAVAHLPADEEHRFGHGKAEALSALVQAALVGGSGIYVVYAAIQRVVDPQPITYAGVALGVMGLSVVGSIAIVTVQSWVLRRVKSVAIEADSLHYRGDVLSNLAVVAALLVEQWTSWPWLDPIVGTVIAAYLFGAAFKIARESIDLLMDRELSEEERERIFTIVLDDPDTRGMHDLRTRSIGRSPHIELHLELEGHLDLWQAHEVTDRVELALGRAFPGAAVTIHQEPEGLEDERLDDRVRAASERRRKP
ncbi:MAG: cation diffusion facilitator family transporter [Planctomycetota bacterium]